MRHTFLSWDSCFRNFHHLIDAISFQNYDLDQVELIYVEQRTREKAKEYNNSFGLPSLADRLQQESLPFLKVLFMNDPEEQPYHLGRILNHGLKFATGELITIMDGDMLLPEDFLMELDKAHAHQPSVLNIERKMCPRPLNANLENWQQGTFDYHACLQICRNSRVIPRYVTNKGPMISASANAFKAVGGYDEHEMFATGLSRAGQDLNARLELATGSKSSVINRVAVHPYHPQGFSRNKLDAVRILRIQADVINWTRRHKVSDWRDRVEVLDTIYRRNMELFQRVHNKQSSGSLLAPIQQSVFAGKIYKWFFQLVKPFKP